MHERQQGIPVKKKEIRLQYSGYVIFAAKLLSVVTGLIFQFMIARSTTGPEYDLWFNLNDVLGYFTLFVGVLPFWVMRFVAREKEGATKTGFLANLTISLIATFIYLALIPLITSALGISGKYGDQYISLYFIVAVQIVELYSISLFEGCLQASIPQTVGYGLLVQQLCKVILGYIIIIYLGQPLLGAVVSTIVAFSIQIAYYGRLLREELRRQIKWEYVKEWFKGSLANIYNVLGNQIAALIFIMLFMYGGIGGRGRYGVAAQVANVISYSSFLAFALYPKLLAERKHEDITISLKMVLMFALPMTAGAIALSDSYITLFRPEYPDSGLVLVVLAMDALVATVSGIFSSVVYGVETVDENEKISFRNLVKSRLFIVFSLPYLHSAITIPVTFYVLTAYVINQPLQAALSVAIINSSARFAMFLILYAVTRKVVKINIPWRSITKYVFASAVMAIVLFALPHPTRITTTLAMTAIGGAVYLALLMSIDKETRKLSKAVLQEVKVKLRMA
jgi:O-antigen/teichoic acid export membrane protein